ncbi:hypothetical protein NPIL_20011 [Nephila pilipes]|uniref:C2H2-type domain-containing protein n=1 Tax=Nephila pilipes TaxID=299642 RepID=A0A8X6PNS3_NEPPI|nr:hypothetical protein NPIL_20011 [Nephila pilipes]
MAQAMASFDAIFQQARDFITRCKIEFKWEDLSNHLVMDIGCGAFFYCTRAILEQFPEVACVVPIDRNAHIIKLERSFGEDFEIRLRDARIQFHPVDILDSVCVQEFNGKIDKIVCRNTLQQICNKEQALRNIYDMLRPGGHAGILFCLANPVGTWQSTISSMEKWKQYMKGPSPHFIPGSLETDYYKDLMEEIGFQEVRSEIKDVKLSFSNYQSCLRELLPIGRSLLDIPAEKMNDFKRDSLQLFRELIGWSEGPMNYTASELVLFAVKPLESSDSEASVNKSLNMSSLTCGICDKVFSSKFRLLTHMETHNEVRRLYSCPHCSQSFTRLDNLRRHVRMIHKGEESSQSFMMPFIENL